MAERARRPAINWSGNLLQVIALLAIVILAIALVAALSNRPLILVMLALAIVVGGVMVLDRRFVLPVIILALPLEISKQLFPFLQASQSTVTTDLEASIIDFGRVAILAAGILWVIQAPSTWAQQLPRSRLLLPLALLFGLFVISLSYTEALGAAGREILRLVFNIAFFLIIPLFVQDRKALNWALLAIVISGLVLGLVGIYQEVTDTYFWVNALEESDASYRNATFADPNIFARFLVVAVVIAVALLPASGNRVRLWLLIPTLGIGLLALLFTSSRGSWATAAIILPLVVLLMPFPKDINRQFNTMLILAGIAGVLSLVILGTLLEASFIGRLETFQQGIRVIGARYYLIQAGWEMFLDNPLTGVGLQGFREAIEGPYRSFIWPGYGVTLPHTSTIAILAELGILGMTVLAFLLYRWAQLCWGIYKESGLQDRAVVLGLGGAFLAIFLSSQSEGRFLEDAYLWLIMGLGVALSLIKAREKKQTEVLAEKAESTA